MPPPGKVQIAAWWSVAVQTAHTCGYVQSGTLHAPFLLNPKHGLVVPPLVLVLVRDVRLAAVVPPHEPGSACAA